MNSPRRFINITSVLALLLVPQAGTARGGIPEPGLVLYGVITSDGQPPVRLTTGSIEWSFQPEVGAPVVATGALTNVNDQFSYILVVPCESEVAGLGVSADSLVLSAAGESYDRSAVLVNGVAAEFLNPALKSTTLDFSDRGRIERIDLTLGATGIPDFETWIAGFGLQDTSPEGDPDGDGLTNYEEYLAGTDPGDSDSAFKFIHISEDETGVTIQWSSILGRSYSVERSTSLFDSFETIQSGLIATPDVNTFVDTTANGSDQFFYRITIE